MLAKTVDIRTRIKIITHPSEISGKGDLRQLRPLDDKPDHLNLLKRRLSRSALGCMLLLRTSQESCKNGGMPTPIKVLFAILIIGVVTGYVRRFRARG